MFKTKRDFYNLLSKHLCALTASPRFGAFFLKVYDLAFKTYYNLEKYRMPDPWLIKSDFQRKRFMTIVNFISDKKYRNCLDVGCGTGYVTNLLAPYCKKITGLDISSYAIERAKKQYPQTKIKFVSGTIRTCPLDPDYDLIILADVQKVSTWAPLKIFARIFRREVELFSLAICLVHQAADSSWGTAENIHIFSVNSASLSKKRRSPLESNKEVFLKTTSSYFRK